MRIVVLSDSHGNTANVRKILEAQRGAELFLHLGDGEREYLDAAGREPGTEFRFVRGNCDFYSAADIFLQFEAAGHSVFMTHGHMYNVKFGLDELLYAAQGRGAEIVLYGHTHIPRSEYIDGLYVVNPGSCSGQRGPATYAVIDITKAGVVPVLIPLRPAAH